MYSGIKGYLKTYSKLQELSFIKSSAIFNQDVSFLCDLNLRKLKLGRLFCRDLKDADFVHNIGRLLTSQATSLQHFGMDSDNRAILQLVFGMNIKSLHVLVWSFLPNQTYETLPINNTIEYATIKFVCCPAEEYNIFLAKIPNLKKLYHDKLTMEALESVVTTAKKLQTFLFTDHSLDITTTSYSNLINRADPNPDMSRNINFKQVKKDFEFKI